SVNELDRLVARLGSEYLAAVGDSRQPVREAVRGVVRSDDQPGSDTEAAPAEDVGHHLLAERLQRAVRREGDLLDGRIVECSDRRPLVVARGSLRIDGAARDEGVLLDRTAEELRRGADDARREARGVDDRVPLAALESREIAVSIAQEPFDLREELGIRPASREDGHLVATVERRLDDVAAEEQRPS